MKNYKVIENGLVPVMESKEGNKLVDARELHKFLGSNRDFSSWIKDRLEYIGATENEEYSPILGKTSKVGGRPTKEYVLSIDTAKEISMLERNQKGKEARKYFIAVEKKFKEIKSIPQAKNEDDVKLKNANARLKNANARVANMYLKLSNVDTLSTEYKNILISKASEVLAGQAILPLPKSTQKTLTATELGKILGLSAQRVGKITNEYNLKNNNYGEWYRDKSKYSSKEVDTFRYYENIIPTIKNIIEH